MRVLDDHGRHRHVVHLDVVGGHGLDLVHRIHAFNDTSKNAIAPAIRPWRIKLRGIVFHIDEELARGAMGIVGARHGDSAARVVEARLHRGFGLIHNGLIPGFYLQIRSETAALDHERGDDPVEGGAFIEALVDVIQKVGDGFWGGFGLQFECEAAQACGELDPWLFGLACGEEGQGKEDGEQ